MPFLRILALSVLAAVSLFVPVASAQVAPAAALTLADVPTGAVHTNDTVYVEVFQVGLTLRNLVCSAPATFQVALRAEAAEGQNVTGNNTIQFSFTPSPAAFTVPAGEYLTKTFAETREVTLQIRPLLVPKGGLEVPVTLGVTLPGDTRGCQAQGALPAQQQVANYEIGFRRSTEPDPEPGPQMPGPPLLAVLVVLGLFVVLRRRAS